MGEESTQEERELLLQRGDYARITAMQSGCIVALAHDPLKLKERREK